ncbi:MAG: hypothetical protein A3G32_08215 [Deltaproteobacteria bacterium RIFCSPLOWO2_12_FULL_40_28]|nr:MAG: hypothetical protein A3C45_00915 [Deltaproteobacteria bacterium RIFCSPHIGHO2_02_FULL_40_28]OGQ20894.1 MAG: hypothetical protein A3E27_03580 [Deltaproteobacteria bacterium RIFCSPHIGHO2_12_FULL_40_32]OGQ39295.1 MAG: hypothetical protein A3I69_04940 [Deltaproteobacteria bacterium RIFCSPLOWO2_02_FULL_40_36]OGQ54576.1 MAG: hypothetical protein A3G32_08215 [Deltaproteobacteria bacterium RIFCSPLOWO2_12_FULL_40_28]
MNIAVLIKQVPDTETKIKIKPDQSGIEEGDIKFIVNPYDEFAIEEAIKTKEKIPGATTFVVSIGPERAGEAIRTALAMGIDKGIHIVNNEPALDSYLTAKVLHGVLKERNISVIFSGKQAIDFDHGQLTQMLADMLDWPCVMITESFQLKEDKSGAKLVRRLGGGAKEIYEIAFPFLVGCEKGLNTPRYASLPGIMKAKTKPVEKLLVSNYLEGQSAFVSYKNYELPPERMAGKKLEGEPQIQAQSLVKLLREESKVI